MIVVEPQIAERRKDRRVVTEPFGGGRQVYDPVENVTVIKLFSGDYYVSKGESERITTILGSCVSVCIRDVGMRIGGMNHFLLPGDYNDNSVANESARYGVFAMEVLINGLLKVGGRKDRFEIKVFGGGNVINNSVRIGSKNASFIREFLRKEGYSITSEDLEGDFPRRLNYYPDTGKAMVRQLMRREDMAVVDEEVRYARRIADTPANNDIELF